MVIYGTALLAMCVLVGLWIGELLGQLLGIKSNVGGVGFAMTLLILASMYLNKRMKLPKLTQQGIIYWNLIYIPIVVAMAASQNVVAALKGGTAAIVAGFLAVIVCFFLIPLISKIGD